MWPGQSGQEQFPDLSVLPCAAGLDLQVPWHQRRHDSLPDRQQHVGAAGIVLFRKDLSAVLGHVLTVSVDMCNKGGLVCIKVAHVPICSHSH